MIAAAVSSMDDGSRRSPASRCGRKAAADRELLRHRIAIHIGRVVIGVEAEEPVLPDLDDTLRGRDEPDDEGFASCPENGGRRDAGDERNIDVLNPRLAR